MRGVAASLAVVLAVLALVSAAAYANPIPSPTVVLKHEYIYMTFRQGPGADRVTVTVTGIYPFRNVGFKELDMYFPVPPEAVSNGEAWVRVDGHLVKYEVVSEGEVEVPGGGVKRFKYDSVLGALPMLKWRVKFNGSLKDFTVNVTYRYVIKPTEVEVPCNCPPCCPPRKVGVFVFRTIYAMATGRFYYVYSKRVVADVTLRFVGSRLMGAPINISLVPAPMGSEGFTKVVLPPGTIGGGNDTATIHLVIGSDLFKGMRRDLLVEFQMPIHVPTTTPPGGWGGGHGAATVTVTKTVAQQTVTITVTKTVTIHSGGGNAGTNTSSTPAGPGSLATPSSATRECPPSTSVWYASLILVLAVLALCVVALALVFRGRK